MTVSQSLNSLKLISRKIKELTALQKTRVKARFFLASERPIQQKLISADTDNWPVLPILSADISAKIQA